MNCFLLQLNDQAPLFTNFCYLFIEYFDTIYVYHITLPLPLTPTALPTTTLISKYITVSTSTPTSAFTLRLVLAARHPIAPCRSPPTYGYAGRHPIAESKYVSTSKVSN